MYVVAHDVEHLVFRVTLHHVIAVVEGNPVILMVAREYGVGGTRCQSGHHLLVLGIPRANDVRQGFDIVFCVVSSSNLGIVIP